MDKEYQIVMLGNLSRYDFTSHKKCADNNIIIKSITVIYDSILIILNIHSIIDNIIIQDIKTIQSYNYFIIALR